MHLSPLTPSTHAPNPSSVSLVLLWVGSICFISSSRSNPGHLSGGQWGSVPVPLLAWITFYRFAPPSHSLQVSRLALGLLRSSSGGLGKKLMVGTCTLVCILEGWHAQFCLSKVHLNVDWLLPVTLQWLLCSVPGTKCACILSPTARILSLSGLWLTWFPSDLSPDGHEESPGAVGCLTFLSIGWAGLLPTSKQAWVSDMVHFLLCWVQNTF